MGNEVRIDSFLAYAGMLLGDVCDLDGYLHSFLGRWRAISTIRMAEAGCTSRIRCIHTSRIS